MILHTNVFSFGDEYGLSCICLDSCASEFVFRNKDLFIFISFSNNPLVVRGVNVDSPPMYITYEGDTIFRVVY